jgi:electron transport complex protein RnfE
MVVMGSVREIIGSGTWFGLVLFPEEYAVRIMTMAPGGFFTFGVLIAVLAAILQRQGKKMDMSQNKCLNCGDCDGCKEVGA